jgi:hypothetical protein
MRPGPGGAEEAWRGVKLEEVGVGVESNTHAVTVTGCAHLFDSLAFPLLGFPMAIRESVIFRDGCSFLLWGVGLRICFCFW